MLTKTTAAKPWTTEARPASLRLVRIARGRWDVVAPVEREGRCPVLDRLDRPAPGLRTAGDFLGVCLRVYMPLEGPPTASRHLCQPLGDGIFELRSHPRQPDLSLLFFGDEDGRIVCTGVSSPEGRKAEIRTARLAKERYFEAKLARELEILGEAAC